MATNSFLQTIPRNLGLREIRQAPDHVDVRVLAANVNEDHTIPANTSYVVFSSTADFYAKKGGTAAVPAADVTDGSGSELNPAAYVLTGVTTIGLISGSACTITMAFYS